MVKHLFIINPNAGKSSRTNEIKSKIESLHLTSPYEIMVTKDSAQAGNAIKAYAQSFGGQLRIYAIGGDGTFRNAVAAAYPYENTAVACIPTGSGNDFIRSFETIPKERFLDLREMISGSVHKVDLLSVGDKKAINMISVGYDCAVAKEMERFKKLPLIGGSAAYDLSVLYCLINRMENKFSIIADGKQIENKCGSYLFALAANGRFYGGGFKAAPYSNMQDGYIDFIRVPSISRTKFLKLVTVFKSGKHFEDKRMDFIKLEHCKSMQIISANKIDVNVDGDIFTMNNPEIKILEKAVNIILPTETVLSQDKLKSVNACPITA